MEEEKIIEERKEKLIGFFKKNPGWIFFVVLIFLVILGVYIRYLPLADHGGHPGLWDITTNDYTLGPDLDPFLFLRYAKDIIQTGHLPVNDAMRNVPLGFDASTELQMVAYMIVLTYRLVNIFGSYSINYAGAFMPVLFFAFTIIAFFLFVREIFMRKNEKTQTLKANIIASISTLFMIIIPAFLSRTVAGIPEKESIAFFFMFAAFYLFLKAWKSEKIYSSSIFGILAGVSTALMGLSWGGVTYLYITIGLTGLIAFILNKFHKKEILAYGLWVVSALLITLNFTNRFSFKSYFFGTDTGLALIVLIMAVFHLVLWRTKIHSILKLEKIKLPKTIISLILLIVVGLVFVLIISPSIISEKISQINGMLIKPIIGRWSTTVAENRQPYFTEWYGSFGKAIFWLFFIGSVLLFYKMFNNLKKRDVWILTSVYVFFFFGLVFSRYAAHPAALDGEGFLSRLFYFGSALLLSAAIIYLYIKYHKEENFSFEKTEFEYLLLFTLFALTLFTARSAVRLIMVLVPIAPIFLSYLLVESGFKIKESEKKDMKIVFGILLIIVLFFSCSYAYSYYTGIKNEAYNYIPYYYTLQWQEAMSWVRNNTPANAVFSHWWDYGYWVQSIGDRATVTDGGNLIVWWNYLTGRLVLTGDNQQDSLNFLWNHNATHLLIDSSDIGKYGAFSQIGSDINYDRFSPGPFTMLSDTKQTQETANGTIRIYQGGSIVDEDINYEQNGSKIYIPGPTKDASDSLQYHASVLGVVLEKETLADKEAYKQPNVVYGYQTQIKLPVRYIYMNGQLYDFKTGINAAIYIIPKLDAANNGLSLDKDGALIYISPRILRGFLGQAYLLNNSLGKFNNFKLSHTEPDFILKQIDTSGSLGDFVYYQGLRGPIKIWTIEYTGNEKTNPDYLLKQQPSYITWRF